MTTVEALAGAVRRALAEAGLPGAEPTFERPRQREHGDWATNVALTLAKPAGRPPRQIAEELADRLQAVEGIAKVEVAGPGFLNFHLAAGALGEVVREVVAAGQDWGRTAAAGSAGRANVEFISVNPTGPLHVGHGRWVAGGDALARLLEATGWDVTREYYLNDAGTQMDLFGASVAAAMRGEPTPEDGYRGGYVGELAERIGAENVTGEESVRERSLALMVEEIRGTLERIGISIDVWFSERVLRAEGRVAAIVESLRARGEAYEADGATWLATSRYGDDKDRVLIRSTGEPTYFAADCAYMADKVARGFGLAIYLLGADHQGYVQRLQAIARAERVPEGVIEIVIGQLVNLTRDGLPLRMSKRAGDYVTLDELLDEVGPDAARYTFVRTSTDQTLEFDLAKVVREERDNPVHYVNYSHARIAGILRTAQQRGVEPGDVGDAPVELLADATERDLLNRISAFPEKVAFAAAQRAPHTIARYAEDLAESFHRFYEACQVVGPDPGLTRARYWLCAAAQRTFVAALALLGVTPRERM